MASSVGNITFLILTIYVIFMLYLPSPDSSIASHESYIRATPTIKHKIKDPTCKSFVLGVHLWQPPDNETVEMCFFLCATVLNR